MRLQGVSVKCYKVRTLSTATALAYKIWEGEIYFQHGAEKVSVPNCSSIPVICVQIDSITLRMCLLNIKNTVIINHSYN